MTSSAAGKKSRRDAACALPTDALREAKRKPLENVGIFSGVRPGTARAPRQNPFAQPSLLFLCPSGQSFRITLGKKKKPLYAVGLSSSRTANSGSLAVTSPHSPGRRHSRFTRCDDTSRRAQPGGRAAMRHCPRPFFSESEALKKIFFTKSTFEGRLPARVVCHTSPQETAQRRTTRDTTASRSLHAKELTRPPEGAP